MHELPTARLEDIVFLVNDKVTSQKDESKPYLGLEHLPSGGTSVLGFSNASESVSTNNVFQSGDVLFGKLRPRLRKSLQVTFGGYSSTDILVLRSNKGIHPPFAGFVLQSDPVFTEAIRTEEGTKMPRCSWGTLRKLQVFCPVEDEQQKIANILAELSEAIEQNETLIAKTEKIKAGLMHDLFTRGVSPNGQLRLSREEAPELYKESAIGWIPKLWELDQLGVRARVKGGKRLPAGHEFSESVTSYRYLHTTDFIGKEIKYETMAFLEPRTFKALERYEIHNGNIYISIAGVNLGYGGIFRPDIPERTILTENAAKILLEDESSAEFVARQINAPIVKRQIAVEAGIGAGVPKLALFRIEKLHFVWPPNSEQLQIVEILSSTDRSLDEQRRLQSKLASMKRGLMNDLLTGRVRVSAHHVSERKVASAHV